MLGAIEERGKPLEQRAAVALARVRVRDGADGHDRRLRAAAREGGAHEARDGGGVRRDHARPHLVAEDEGGAVAHRAAAGERRLDPGEVDAVAEHLDDRVEPALDAQPPPAPRAAVARRVRVDRAAARPPTVRVARHVRRAHGIGIGDSGCGGGGGGVAIIPSSWREGGGVLAGEVAALDVPPAVDDAAGGVVQQHLVAPDHLAKPLGQVEPAAHGHVGDARRARRLARRGVHPLEHADVGGGLGGREDVGHRHRGEGAQKRRGRRHRERLARHHHVAQAARQRQRRRRIASTSTAAASTASTSTASRTGTALLGDHLELAGREAVHPVGARVAEEPHEPAHVHRQ